MRQCVEKPESRDERLSNIIMTHFKIFRCRGFNVLSPFPLQNIYLLHVFLKMIQR